MVHLPCKRLHPAAKLPSKAGPEEIGWDICCVDDDDFLTVESSGIPSFGCVSTKYINFLPGGTDLVDGDRAIILEPYRSHKFHTGFSCSIDPGFAMLLWDRSGMGAGRNIHRLAGVIDCTYRGEWLVSLINLSTSDQVIKCGDKIIQGIISEVIEGKPFWVDDLPESYRGEAGFGKLSGR